MMKKMPWIAALVLTLTATSVGAQQPPVLIDLSLADLLELEVTSVSHKEQKVGKTAAAVYVITQEDIKRSGAQTVPDLMRLVPGFSVGQLNASSWSVASRGLGGILANKLLVLIDGRSVYSPNTGGVHWELMFLPLDMIQQIEVVRGPGGSLWGANAINGVINIITKPADQSQYGRVTMQNGTLEPGTVGLSYGNRMGTRGYWSARSHYLQRSSPGSDGDADRAKAFYAQTRFDWKGADIDAFRLTVDMQQGEHLSRGPVAILAPPYQVVETGITDFSSGSAVFGWTRTHSSTLESSLQGYYYRYTHAEDRYSESWDVADVEFRQRRALGARHELVGGGGYRFSRIDASNTMRMAVLPEDERRQLVTAFAQDEIKMTERISVTPGIKLEHNKDTGVEFQPSLRTLWEVNANHTVWGAASRGVRTPNRWDIGLYIAPAVFPVPGSPLPAILTINGTPDFRSEVQKAYEAGYRFHRGPLSVDATVFQSDYDHLHGSHAEGARPGFALGVPALLIVERVDNSNNGTSHGAEISTQWAPLDWWRTSASYSYLKVRLFDAAGSPVTGEGPLNGTVPGHQWHTRTYVSLPLDIDLSALFTRVSALPFKAAQAGAKTVAAYNRLDATVGWTYRNRVELSGGVKNLLRDRVPEYYDILQGIEATPVRHEVYGQIGWKF